MELLLHQWGDWPELYKNTDKTEATEIVIIDSQMNYRGKLDTYVRICGYTLGHAYGVRVQKVQRVQRVVVAASPQLKKKGARLRRELCRRIVYAPLRGQE